MKSAPHNIKMISLSFLLLPSLSYSQSNVLIEGFAQWQADRIERIALDQAIFGMMKNDYVQAFFPNTTEAVESYGGSTSAQRLIPLIQATIKNDIKNAETTFTSCIKTYINNIQLDINSGDPDKINLALNKLEFFNSKLSSIKNAKNSEKALPELYKEFRGWVCNSTTNDHKDNVANRKIDLLNTLPNLPAGLSENKVNENAKAALDQYSRYKKTPEANEFSEAVALVNAMLSLINQYEDYRNLSASSKNSVIAIHFFVRFFELFGSNDQNYTQFKSLGLFLASLIEAGKPEDVAAVLDTFIDDQAAYRNKRLDANTALYSWFTLPSYNATTQNIKNTPYTGSCWVIGCENTLFVGSYFGASVVRLPDEDTLEEKVQLRFFGPVGLEYKILNVYGNPITLNFSPIDIGNYISNELQDVEYTARFSDIVAPSVFLSYSMKDRPFSFLLGYQKDSKVGNLVEENTFFISFAFDLTIFTIY